MRSFFYCAVLMAIAIPVQANDKKKPDGVPPVERGEEHKVLQSLVGVWDAKVKLLIDPKKPIESTGAMTRKMILGGNFLQESYQGNFFGQKFEGLGIIGYDMVKEKFVNTWCDNRSTSIMILHGTYDSRKKIFTQVGEDYDATAMKALKVRDVLKIVSADEQVLEMYRTPKGGMEFKLMEITFTRQKGGKR